MPMRSQREREAEWYRVTGAIAAIINQRNMLEERVEELEAQIAKLSKLATGQRQQAEGPGNVTGSH